MMDPERVRAYLQAACAGLGFDIGEVWFTTSENGTSTVAAIEEGVTCSSDFRNESSQLNDITDPRKAGKSRRKKLKFLQLYTSKSYDNRRNDLLRPSSEYAFRRSHSSSEDLQKHVLSPKVVNAISNTAQVIWANCPKTEGFLGRSDMRLQTAVGMPVAMDSDGNMCIVVMFSPNNIHSNDEAIEYLQSISQSARCTSIPCLLPVIDSSKNKLAHEADTYYDSTDGLDEMKLTPLSMDDIDSGITARFVNIDGGLTVDKGVANNTPPEPKVSSSMKFEQEFKPDHELSTAPKDFYGIPMLPSFAELDSGEDKNKPPVSDAESAGREFDYTSYGVWSTIMNMPADDLSNKPLAPQSPGQSSIPAVKVEERGRLLSNTEEFLARSAIGISSGEKASRSRSSSASPVVLDKPILHPQQKERLEEFASAFLGMSVFDAADVWTPSSDAESDLDVLGHQCSVSGTKKNEGLNCFKQISENTSVKAWSGAVGRAFGSGNPVWSTNKDIIWDSERTAAFRTANIKTALAVPIFSEGSAIPSCIFCCYSLIRTDSVPFVLKFVQQALRLLWLGLDNIEPHKSIGKEIWDDVAPADLGEMAANTEMQKAFLVKKRPYDDISADKQDFKHSYLQAPPTLVSNSYGSDCRDRSSSLAFQLQALNMPTGESSAPLQAKTTKAPLALGPAPMLPTGVMPSMKPLHPIGQEPLQQETQMQQLPTVLNLHNHVQEAVRSIGEAVSRSVHQGIPTNQERSKRAHILRSPSQISHVPRHQSTQQQSHLDSTEHFPQPTLQEPSPSHKTLQKVEVAHVNYTTPSPAANSTKNDHKEDPAVAMAYINSLNAMARMNESDISSNNSSQALEQSTPISSFNWSSSPSAPTPYCHPVNSFLPNSNTSGVPLTTSFSTCAVTDNTSNASLLTPTNSYNSAITSVAPLPDSINSINHPCSVQSSNSATRPSALNGNGKPCRIQGCNDYAVSRRPYCLRHSGNRLCEHTGCSKCAQGATRFCIAHGGGRRCTFPGCDKGARDKFFCAAHGGGKRCSSEGCNKSAVGGSNLCTSHGGGRRCNVDGCDKSAQSSTKFCVKHGGGKKCLHSGCDKVARGRTMYCAAHGGGVRCKLEGCSRVAIGKMQLCRAHGGGTSRSKAGKKSAANESAPSSEQSDFSTFNRSLSTQVTL